MKKIATICTLHDLLIYDTRKVLYCENQLISVLPAWIDNIRSARLKVVIEHYLVYIKYHVDGILKFFKRKKLMDFHVQDNVAQAFIDEINEKMDDCRDDQIIDALLLSSIQQIIHYKICMYGTISAFAQVLDLDITAGEFYTSEKDEKDIDSRLSFLAEQEINPLAKSPIID
jgi:ferritin-like metal-binding protein YciE